MPPQKWNHTVQKAGHDETPYHRKPTPEQAWDLMFQCLVRYKEEHGDCLVPAKFQADPKLSHWVQTQRSARKRPRCLSEERIKMLDSIGFVWSVNQALWETMFDCLLEYKEEHGHCLVPQSYPQLGQWVDRQRTDKAENRLSPLRREKLEEIGFVWRVSQESWDTMFARLLDFNETHGNCLVPQRYDEDPKLGNWVDNQRYLKNTNRLSAERTKQLNSVGFSWCVTQESWDVMFHCLVKYKKANGDCLISLDNSDNPKLGRWVKEQRKKRHRISGTRKAKLDSIGFVWSVPQAIWNTMYESLLEYRKRHGNCLVPKRYEPNPQLGRWVHNQRLRKDNLTVARREKLESIGFYATGNKTAKLAAQGSAERIQQPKDTGEGKTATTQDSPGQLSPEHAPKYMELKAGAQQPSTAIRPQVSTQEQPRTSQSHFLPEQGHSHCGPIRNRRSGHHESVPDRVASSATSETQNFNPQEDLAPAPTGYGPHSLHWPEEPHVSNHSLARPAGLAAHGYQMYPSSLIAAATDTQNLMERMALELRARELQTSLLCYRQMQSNHYAAIIANNPSFLHGRNMAVYRPTAQQPVIPYRLVNANSGHLSLQLPQAFAHHLASYADTES